MFGAFPKSLRRHAKDVAKVGGHVKARVRVLAFGKMGMTMTT